MWIGLNSTEFVDAALAMMGDGKHGRTTDEGCVISVKVVGEGGGEVLARARLGKFVFLARTERDHPVYPTCRHCKFAKKADTDLQIVNDAGVIRPWAENLAHLVKGASWLD